MSAIHAIYNTMNGLLITCLASIRMCLKYTIEIELNHDYSLCFQNVEVTGWEGREGREGWERMEGRDGWGDNGGREGMDGWG